MDRHRLRLDVGLLGRHAHETGRQPSRFIGELRRDIARRAGNQLRREHGPERVHLTSGGIDARHARGVPGTDERTHHRLRPAEHHRQVGCVFALHLDREVRIEHVVGNQEDRRAITRFTVASPPRWRKTRGRERAGNRLGECAGHARPGTQAHGRCRARGDDTRVEGCLDA